MTKSERYSKVQQALALLNEVWEDLDQAVDSRPASYAGKMCDQLCDMSEAIQKLEDSGMTK